MAGCHQPLDPALENPPPAQGDSPGPASSVVDDIMTARWTTHVIAARMSGVDLPTLERQLDQMREQARAIFERAREP